MQKAGKLRRIPYCTPLSTPWILETFPLGQSDPMKKRELVRAYFSRHIMSPVACFVVVQLRLPFDPSVSQPSAVAQNRLADSRVQYQRVR
jgi:hypothetical protein